MSPEMDRTGANWENIGHLEAKSGNFRFLNPLISGIGDFKREWVSPTYYTTLVVDCPDSFKEYQIY